MPEATYEVWFRSLRPLELAGSTLVLSAPDRVCSWVSSRYARVLQASAAGVLGADVTVDLIADSRAEGHSAQARVEPPSDPTLTFNPKYTFDQFVIGEGNRLAHAAALAVAELPGQAYNPLFLYGPPGVGKTHLLQSIAAYARSYDRGLAVRYTTVEEFTSRFVGALHSGAVARFKDEYRHADILLVDDVQFLESKARTEEEFFHTFNALYECGSQLVLTSDRRPGDMAALEDRLRERFESGLVADIGAPDFDTRLTILRQRAHRDEVDLAEPEALELLAARIEDNVRALEGALIRVVAYHSLTSRPITVSLVDEVLALLYPGRRPRKRSVTEIQHATCEAFGISIDELVSSSRAARVAWPRQVAMYLSRELTEDSLPHIARQFGGRNHTTVLYACQRTGERIASDVDAQALITELTDRLASSS